MSWSIPEMRLPDSRSSQRPRLIWTRSTRMRENCNGFRRSRQSIVGPVVPAEDRRLSAKCGKALAHTLPESHNRWKHDPSWRHMRFEAVGVVAGLGWWWRWQYWSLWAGPSPSGRFGGSVVSWSWRDKRSTARRGARLFLGLRPSRDRGRAGATVRSITGWDSGTGTRAAARLHSLPSGGSRVGPTLGSEPGSSKPRTG